jgi:hypothetical protein
MHGTTTRRTFFGGAAALTAPLAISAAAAGDDAAARLAALEDERAIRALVQAYAQRVTAGVERAPAANVRALALDADISVSIAADGTATARVTCTVDTATPIDGRETLIEMARLQGDGVIVGSARRLLNSSFVKRNGTWQLLKAEFQA